MRPKEDTAAWAFLDLRTLTKMYDSIFESIDDPEIFGVPMSATVDDQRFSSITLNTCNMEMFNLFREGIREYTGIPGFTIGTFSRQEFVEKKSATIYVPQRFARFSPRRLFRSLVHFYPGIAARYEIYHKQEFTENIPGRPKRIGDYILVVGGSAFLEKLSRYPEAFVFHINPYWRFTIRGGERNPVPISADDLDHAARSLDFSRKLSETISPVGIATVPLSN